MSSSAKVMVKTENDNYKEMDVKVLAKKYFAQQNYEQAKKCYEFILGTDPEDVQALCNLAKVLFYLQDYSSALRNAAKAINLEPDYDQAYHIAAKVAEKQDNMFMCEEYLKLGLERCYGAPILKEYYDKVKAMKNAQRTENPFKFTAAKNSSDSTKPQNQNKKSNEEPVLKSKPEPDPGPSIDDCPELVTDSESDDDSDEDDDDDDDSDDDGLDLKNVLNLVQKANQKALPSIINKQAGKGYIENKQSEKGGIVNKKAEKSGLENQQSENGSPVVQQDEFMKTVLTVAKEKNLTYEDVAKNRVQTFKTLCKEGSEAFLEGVYRKAMEKYKEAYDMIDDMPLDMFKINDQDYAVLKYMICLLKIKSANYESIVSAIAVLKEIEEKQARTMPCVYYLLGLAYQTLNRNKFAVEFTEKGLSFLEKDIQFEYQPYPQIYEVIPETKKENLQEKLEELINISRTYRPPDAVCRYHKCLSISNHVIPSRDIFYSDPDFTGYVSAICEEHCKIKFHLNCWRSWKEGIADGRKVTDKDVLGNVCFTEDCVIDSGSRSVIIQIDIIGTDGQVKSSVKSSAKREQSVTKKDKRTESVNEKPSSENTPRERAKRSESLTQDKSTPEPALKEKVEKAPAAKKQKKVAEVKNKNNKDMKDAPVNEELVNVNNNPAIDLNQKLERLKRLRKMNFGYNNDDGLDPEKIDYGIEMDSTLPIDFGIVTPDKELNCQIEFILSMYYDYLKSDGPRKKTEVIKKWDEQKNDLDPQLSVRKNYRGICELLLQSYHFCQVGPYITTSKQVHIAYDLVLKAYEDCKGKTFSESEDLTLDAHLFATADTNSNDLKSHPPDNSNTSENKKFNNYAEALTNSDDRNKINNKSKNSNINSTPSKVIKTEAKKLVPETKLNKPIEAKADIKKSSLVSNSIDSKSNKPIETKSEVKKSIPVPTSNNQESKSVKQPEPKTEVKKSIPVPASNNQETKTAKQPEAKAEVKKSIPVPISNNAKPIEVKSGLKNSLPNNNLDEKTAKPVLTKPSPSKLSVPRSERLSQIIQALDHDGDSLNFLPKTMEETKEENIDKSKIKSYSHEVEGIDALLKDPFVKVIVPNDKLKECESEMEGVKKKVPKPQENVAETGKGKGLSDVNANCKRNIFNWTKNNDLEVDSKLKNNYNFPPPKESNDLNKGQKVTASNPSNESSCIKKPVVVEKFSQTIKIESRDCCCQTKPLKEDISDKDMIEEYKKQLEEWQDKHKKIELMLVESYNNSAQYMDKIESDKAKYKKMEEKYKKALEEKEEAIEELNEIILKKDEAITKKNEINEKLSKKMEQLMIAYRKSERDSIELRKKCRESKGSESSESKTLLEDLQATEELLLIYLKEYSVLFERDFTEKAKEKLDALDRTVDYCSDDTQPTKSQVLSVKKKWEEVQSSVNTQLEEFNAKLLEITERISNGERIKDLTIPSLPSTSDVLFDPIPALLNNLLVDNNKLASLVFQHVPQGILSLRGCLIDMKRLQGQLRPAPLNQTFFPVYAPPQPNIQVQYRPFQPMQAIHLQQPRPFQPPPLMSVNQYAAGVSLVYQQKQATPPEVAVKPPPRSDSVSSNKSDTSVKSTSSTISETGSKTEVKIQNNNIKKPDPKNIEPKIIERAESKGAKPKNENVYEKPILKPANLASQSSPKNDITSKLKPSTSTLTSVNSTSPKAAKAGTSILTPRNSTTSTLTSVNSTGSWRAEASSQQNTNKLTNSHKLFAFLGKNFPNTTEKELERCLKAIRESNSGTLLGLDLDTITAKVKDQLKLRVKNTNSLSTVKYSGPAWGTVKEENIDWNKNEHEDYDCVICFEKLTEINYIQLACKHEFHETCIRKWFKEATVCPTCKRRCLLTDEYPPLV